MSDQNVSRRGLMKTAGFVGIGALVLGGGGLALRSCQRGAAFGGSPEPGPYAVWREVQTALRASPDHPVGRARALVEAGDIDALHRFVRDELRLVSTDSRRFALGDGVRWGPRAALRAGAGTAREKAEILVDLIRQTGRQAEIVEMSAPAREETPGLFFRDVTQPFEPGYTDMQLEDWSRRLGHVSPPGSPPDVSSKEAEVAEISRQLRTAIGAGEEARLGSYRYDDRPVGLSPAVRIHDPERGILYADPIRLNTDLTPDPGKVRQAEAGEATGLLPVTITLTGTTTNTPEETFEIVRADWNAADVAGRQVQISFKPFGETLGILASRAGDLRAFTPILSIQALDGEVLDPLNAIKMGESVTLEGDRLSVSKSGNIFINGDDLGDGAPSGNTGEVASVDLHADASCFPDITLNIRPRNASGRIVDGLSSADFALTDEGKATGHILHSRDRAPKILFLADRSGSMPAAYRGTTSEMQALAERVRTVAIAIHPGAKVTVSGTNSSLWEHLIRAAGSPYNLIVYATDGDLGGREPSEAELSVLKAGPKAIIMDVHGKLEERRQRGGQNIFDAMAAATNGSAVGVTTVDTSAAEEAIRRFLEGEGTELPYRLTYRVLDKKTGLRTAAATIGPASGEDQYTTPAKAARKQKLASLRLTVKVGEAEVSRILAGHDGRGEVTQDDLDELQGAMFGTFLIAMEGPPPPLSVILDDILTAKLSMEPIDRTLAQEPPDLDALISAFEAGRKILPGELATLMSRPVIMSGNEFSFAEQGMRCILYSAYPVMNTDQYRRSVDIMPLSRTFVLAKDRDTMIEKAFEASISLAMAEAMLFEMSTVSVVGDAPLAIMNRERFRSQGLSRKAIEDWQQYERSLREMFPSGGGAIMVGPESGATLAGWAISRETAEVFALLPDGTGGGRQYERIQQTLSELDRVMAVMNLLATAVGSAGALSGMGGASLAVVAGYGQNLARLYAAASMSIILMDASGIAPALRMALASMACEVAKTIGLGVFSNAGRMANRAVTIFSVAESTVGMLGGNSPTSCPI